MIVSSVKEASRPLAQALCRVLVDPHSSRLPPGGFESARSWTRRSLKSGVEYKVVYPERLALEQPPETLDQDLHAIFREHLNWRQPEAFVVRLPDGRVWGRCGAIITSDNILLGDVSREFGAFKGVYNAKHSVFRQLLLAAPTRVHGAVGVVACPGARNYHHWLFDSLPRLHLLRASGWLERLDHLVLDYEALPFQNEGLAALQISLDKLIVPADQWRSHFKADTLVVPSLPSDLCTVSDWVVDFLRKTFLGAVTDTPPRLRRRLFISRRRASTRRERNAEEVLCFLSSLGFEEYFAEDHSIAQTASDFADAEWIIGTHGSGLSNLVFASRGAKVIEFLPPRHLDPYYWILSNHIGGRHGYLFSEGERPDEAIDLVSSKVDADLLVSIDKLEQLMKRMEVES